jgi:hypothetical protein
MEHIRALTFAKYGLWNYLHDDFKNKKPYNELEQIGRNLRGLMKVLVLKRRESSIFAFKRTIERLKEVFGSPLSNSTVQHLGKLRQGGIEGRALFDRLKELYFHYGLHRVKEREEKEPSAYDSPEIICSMAMIRGYI